MKNSLRLGALRARDRSRVAQILDATAVFRPDEISVALELFDEGVVTAGDDTSSADVAPATSSRASASADPDYVFLGAFTPEDELVAYACYGPTPATDRTWDLYWIAVDPSAQGTGSGTTLLSEVERRLSGLHARMLVVETSSRSDYSATREFYLRRGYVEAARVREFYAPEDDRIILTKRFTGSPRRGWGAVA